jgi:hypothetical protein
MAEIFHPYPAFLVERTLLKYVLRVAMEMHLP